MIINIDSKFGNIFLQSMVDSGWKIDDTIRKWSVTQTKGISEQLQLGARVFDFRLGLDDFEYIWKFIHSSIYGDSIEPVLKEMADFLKENQDEFIIILARNNRFLEDYEQLNILLRIFEDNFGDLIYHKEDEWIRRTIGELVAQGNRVMLCFFDPDNLILRDSPIVWFNSWSQFFFNSYADADNYSYMKQYNKQMIELFKSKSSKDLEIFKKESSLNQSQTFLKYVKQLNNHEETPSIKIAIKQGNDFNSGSKFITETRNPINKKNHNNQLNYKHKDKYTGKNLFIFSWTNTASGFTILKSLEIGKNRSIWEMNLESRAKFPEFYDEIVKKYEYPIFGNIMIFDFLDEETARTILQKVIDF